MKNNFLIILFFTCSIQSISAQMVDQKDYSAVDSVFVLPSNLKTIVPLKLHEISDHPLTKKGVSNFPIGKIFVNLLESNKCVEVILRRPSFRVLIKTKFKEFGIDTSGLLIYDGDRYCQLDRFEDLTLFWESITEELMEYYISRRL